MSNKSKAHPALFIFMKLMTPVFWVMKKCVAIVEENDRILESTKPCTPEPVSDRYTKALDCITEVEKQRFQHGEWFQKNEMTGQDKLFLLQREYEEETGRFPTMHVELVGMGKLSSIHTREFIEWVAMKNRSQSPETYTKEQVLRIVAKFGMEYNTECFLGNITSLGDAIEEVRDLIEWDV